MVDIYNYHCLKMTELQTEKERKVNLVLHLLTMMMMKRGKEDCDMLERDHSQMGEGD